MKSSNLILPNFTQSYIHYKMFLWLKGLFSQTVYEVQITWYVYNKLNLVIYKFSQFYIILKSIVCKVCLFIVPIGHLYSHEFYEVISWHLSLGHTSHKEIIQTNPILNFSQHFAFPFNLKNNLKSLE